METTERPAESPVVPGLLVSEPYEVYCVDMRHPHLEQTQWIIRGTDGKLYVVPSEAGG